MQYIKFVRMTLFSGLPALQHAYEECDSLRQVEHIIEIQGRESTPPLSLVCHHGKHWEEEHISSLNHVHTTGLLQVLASQF